MQPIRAPRGSALTARGWPQEAALRMLCNNLDPAVAERPADLVVYGGTGKAARDWPSFHALVRTLSTLDGDETMLVQSGRPVGVFRTHEWAPRVLIANANLVPDWATWPEFRRLESLGLTMYGQMTAGSWIYIGTQGILQGTYETFAAVAAKLAAARGGGHEHSGGSLAGTLTLTAGCGGMGGAQPLAVTMNGGACLIVDVDAARLHRRVETRYLGTVAGSLDEGLALASQAKRDRAALSVGVVGNAAAVVPELLRRGAPVDIVTDQTSAQAGSPERSPSPASSPPISDRCSARARARSGGPHCPVSRPTSRPPTGRSWSCSRTTNRWPGGSGWPANASRSKGFRPGSAGSATANATGPACASTSWSPRVR